MKKPPMKPLTAHELAAKLLKLPEGMLVAYPGLDAKDHHIEAVFTLEGHALVSTYDETIGSPRQRSLTMDDPEVQGALAGAEQAEAKGSALLMLTHECYALIAAARPRHWLTSGASTEAVDWIRQAESLMKVIEAVGAKPPNKPIPLFQCQGDECQRVWMYDQLGDRVPTGTVIGDDYIPGTCPKCGTPCKPITAAAGMVAELQRVLGALSEGSKKL